MHRTAKFRTSAASCGPYRAFVAALAAAVPPSLWNSGEQGLSHWHRSRCGWLPFPTGVRHRWPLPPCGWGFVAVLAGPVTMSMFGSWNQKRSRCKVLNPRQPLLEISFQPLLEISFNIALFSTYAFSMRNHTVLNICVFMLCLACLAFAMLSMRNHTVLNICVFIT